MATPSSQPLRIGYVPEHYLLPLHLASRSHIPFPVELIPFPSGTGHMITSIRSDEIDLAIGLTEGWVAGLLTTQGQKEKGYSIVGSWAQNPLRWAIVTGRNREEIKSVSDLKQHNRVGVSRLGSGSHVMAFVLAQQEGWLNERVDSEKGDGLQIVQLGPFKYLRDGVTGKDGRSPEADFFMWEHFTTKPYFHAGDSPMKKIGEIYTPWPSWHVAASSKTFPNPNDDQRLKQLFQAFDLGVKEFSEKPEEGVKMLGTGELGCHYSEDDAREWLKAVKFADGTQGVDPKVMEQVVLVLQGAGVVQASTSITAGDGLAVVPRFIDRGLDSFSAAKSGTNFGLQSEHLPTKFLKLSVQREDHPFSKAEISDAAAEEILGAYGSGAMIESTGKRSQSSSVSAASPKPAHESLPPHTSEIGTLKTLPNHGTEWIGSSSGIYFVQTVRRAFSAALTGPAHPAKLPLVEDILTGDTAAVDGSDLDPTNIQGSYLRGSFQDLQDSTLGELPEPRVIQELVFHFFKLWHPLFPFLDGAEILRDMSRLFPEFKYQNLDPTQAKTVHPRSPSDSLRMVLFKLIINIASLDRPESSLPPQSRIKAPNDVARIAGLLSIQHDVVSIQTMLAAELYLIATVALRQASTVAGMILKAIFHSGLHRCPLRYAQLSSKDCEIRKRVFWCAYALDRHLSQSLGDPITLQDSDIDVCLSGHELHRNVPRDAFAKLGHEINLHVPANQDSYDLSDKDGSSEELSLDTPEKQIREAALTAYVQYSRLTGRIIEIFHKSIHARFPGENAILVLTSDIETWWNNLPEFLTSENTVALPTGHEAPRAYFSILYHQLLLLLHRPSLSLDPSRADFQHGLQVCIKASRNTISALKRHQAAQQSMFLPTLLSSTWMAGMIVAFACHLGKYSVNRAVADIKSCLELLQQTKWRTAAQCHLVLSSFLADISRKKALSTESLDSRPILDRRSKNKRQASNSTPSTPKRHHASSGNPVVPQSSDTDQLNPIIPSQDSNPQPLEALEDGKYFVSPGWTVDETPQDQGIDVGEFHFDPNLPVDFTLPSLGDDDTLLWNDFDFNMADIFQSATWENLVGSNTGAAPAWKYDS